MLTVIGAGLAALAITVWPDAGAKFGGTLAFAPGIAVAALITAGRRASPAKLAMGCTAGVATVTALVLADHARPAAAQTHLGQFATQIGDGSAGAVVGRKLSAMLHTVAGSIPLTVLALAATAGHTTLVLRPPVSVAAWLDRRAKLRAGLAGAATMAVVGFAVQDSGFAVHSMALRLTLPLLAVLALRPEEANISSGKPKADKLRLAPTSGTGRTTRRASGDSHR